MVLGCVMTVASFAQVPADREALLNGEGAGQAKFAEVNGYPGPKHVLELADSLNLSETQKKQIQNVFDDMSSRARAEGKRIVEAEEKFNRDFATGSVEEHYILKISEEIGKRRGKLRSIHLNAHLRAKAILTREQTETYKRLRGIGASHKSPDHKH